MQMIPDDQVIAIQNRVMDMSIPVPESGCWIWTGAMHPNGYCRTSVCNITLLAHRVSYEAFNGLISDGLLVCHRCDVRTCVNPEHLFLGNHAINNTDMFKKGRHIAAHGESSGGSKLSESDVRRIISLRGVITQREIAAMFGVRQPAISDIHRNITWRSLLGGVHGGL